MSVVELKRMKSLPVPVAPPSPESLAAIETVNAYIDQVLSEERSKGNFSNKLRKRNIRLLLSVPEEQRAPAWFCTLTAMYFLYRKAPLVAQNLEIVCYNYLKENEAPEAADSFRNRIAAAASPYRLSRHGFRIPFAKRDCAPLASELKDTISRIEQATGKPVFINSGTLLGAYRDGIFIPHDDDVDLAIHLGDMTEKEATRELKRVADVLGEAGLLAAKTEKKLQMALLKIHSLAPGIEVDIFPAWSHGGKYYVWPHSYGDLDVQDVLPLGEQSIHGVAMPAPNNPDPMIAQNYGPGWRNPNDRFTFRWRLARRRFASFFKEWELARKQ